MQNTSTLKSRYLTALLLAAALWLAGEGTALAWGYGSGSCSVWQSIIETLYGVHCKFV
jgi:hypothetical protein